jgi:sRNA-binding protein
MKMEQMFGAQGKPREIKKAEAENLTEEQKRLSEEREATYNAGHEIETAKEEFSKENERLSEIYDILKMYKGKDEKVVIHSSRAHGVVSCKIVELSKTSVRVKYRYDRLNAASRFDETISLQEISKIIDSSHEARYDNAKENEGKVLYSDSQK